VESEPAIVRDAALVRRNMVGFAEPAAR
jgi:hypothetical protein